MKKFVKVLGFMAIALCLGFTLVACGEDEGVKYNYSKATIETGGTISGIDSVFGSMETMYDTMYKGSSIEVSDTKIKWVYTGAEGTFDVSKDGDKYVLSGDMMDTLKTSVSQMGATDITISMAGSETEDGFEIVISESFRMMGSQTSMTIKFAFTKA